jgi:hypothetical protein
MPSATFDGPNKIIQLPSLGTYNVGADLYSQWKLWARSGNNSGYLKAFDTTGGDAVGSGQEIAPYFFCRNDLGWRIKMPEDNGEIIVTGNLFPRDPSTSLFEQTSGYDAFLRLEVSTRAVVVTVNSGSGLTVPQAEALNRIDLQASLIPGTL